MALLAAWLLAGCVAVRHPGPARGPLPLPIPVLLVARVEGEAARPIAERATRLLARALEPLGPTLGADALLARAEAAGLGVEARHLLAGLERGAGLSAEQAEWLRSRFGLAALLAVDVTAYEQVWGEYAKFTRVAVRLVALDTASGTRLWQTSREVEVEGMRGRAFPYALERAVEEASRDLAPRPRFSLVEWWRSWRR
jgi:hypothetical protein